MPSYEFFIYSNSALQFNVGTNAFDFSASYDYTADRYRIVVDDDDANMDASGDTNQTATVYDMAGNVVAAGEITSPSYAEISVGGSPEYLDRIEVNGVHYGYTPSVELTPGTSYSVTDSGPGGMTHTYFENNSVACFSGGTIIDTARGECRIQDLQIDDRILTYDHGYQPILWIGRTSFSATRLWNDPRKRPVHFTVGALDQPGQTRPLAVSGEHRILLKNAQVELLFGTSEVLAAARFLSPPETSDSIQLAPTNYFHLLLPHHEIIRANGIWCESLFPGDQAIHALPTDAQWQIDLATNGQAGNWETARRCLCRYEALVLSQKRFVEAQTSVAGLRAA